METMSTVLKRKRPPPAEPPITPGTQAVRPQLAAKPVSIHPEVTPATVTQQVTPRGDIAGSRKRQRAMPSSTRDTEEGMLSLFQSKEDIPPPGSETDGKAEEASHFKLSDYDKDMLEAHQQQATAAEALATASAGASMGDILSAIKQVTEVQVAHQAFAEVKSKRRHKEAKKTGKAIRGLTSQLVSSLSAISTSLATMAAIAAGRAAASPTPSITTEPTVLSFASPQLPTRPLCTLPACQAQKGTHGRK